MNDTTKQRRESALFRAAMALLTLVCVGAELAPPKSGNDPLASEPQFLPVDEAFVLSAHRADDQLVLRWDMPHGYYLYRHAFSVKSNNEGALGEPVIPHGMPKVDAYFGETEVYYGDVEIVAAIDGEVLDELTVRVTYQGCADYGLCYPPQRRSVALAANGGAVVTKVADAGDNGP